MYIIKTWKSEGLHAETLFMMNIKNLSKRF